MGPGSAQPGPIQLQRAGIDAQGLLLEGYSLVDPAWLRPDFFGALVDLGPIQTLRLPGGRFQLRLRDFAFSPAYRQHIRHQLSPGHLQLPPLRVRLVLPCWPTSESICLHSDRIPVASGRNEAWVGIQVETSD